MPVSLLDLSDGHCSLEFLDSDFKRVKQALFGLYGKPQAVRSNIFTDVF